MSGEVFVIGVVLAVALVAARLLGRTLGVPEAIVLVALGGAASFLPGATAVDVPPDAVLYFFLPPLVYHAAFVTAPREAKEDAVPIGVLAFGLTLVTALSVMAAALLVVPGLTWPQALALGAAVAPTDPVAATSTLQKLGAPRRLVTILEGESLVNDGVALTLFGLALAAMAHPVTAGETALLLVKVVLGGVGYGLALAWAIGRLRPLIKDGGGQIVLSLVTPFLAYFPAEHFGFSGVLATIVTGFMLGIRGPGVLQPASRLSGRVFWDVLVFLLESALFVLLGLQIHKVFDGVAGQPAGRLALAAVLVIAVVVTVRQAWTWLVFPLARYLPTRPLDFEHLGPRDRLLMGWAGMRGAITLAIALSIPLTAEHRALLLFLAAVVVLATLVVQASTIGPLMRLLGLQEGRTAVVEEATAREALLEVAMSELDRLAADQKIDDQTADVFRQLFELRLDRVRALLDQDGDGPDADRASPASATPGRGLRRELITAQRSKLHELYASGTIGADTLRRIGHELDLEDRRGGTPAP
ncbi:Na+/H+ antiporter [Spongiactinospora gelatinilytica]|uniref:Na+/H+ antiporter n=1 Tax=Spongiactinospora gelatinilytica TaxID=2666298 RepID=A0A2W2HR34_9ACTN|nr:Na+/H+ antiporter [Spongiactinospora gelatinilytica]PZG53000.1 Na+/H+ antiporter [Spongiactinospora gelatinilytica]